MYFDVFNMIGLFSLAASGAIIAVEEKCNFQGVYVVGLVASFGGGVMSSLVTHIPISSLWGHSLLIPLVLFPITLILFMRSLLAKFPRSFVFFDAMALSAFAIHGSVHAVSDLLPMMVVMLAAVLTGAGGGVIRDLVVGRGPFVLYDKWYAVWPLLAGIVISLSWADSQVKLYVLFVLLVMLRMISNVYQWSFPVGKRQRKEETIKSN